jgi:hypothetical protein
MPAVMLTAHYNMPANVAELLFSALAIATSAVSALPLSNVSIITRLLVLLVLLLEPPRSRVLAPLMESASIL